ncbi:MAG: translesion error-prone DNA polymerase V autoproteolytic subunit [Lentisphaeria bacterium]|nr:translesion error-prone DNA polymerase V autoproteolytic subunit [Lentisphaeria bacterium]
MTGKREFPEPGPESAPAGSNPPLMESPVAAGFPSPAEQYAETPLDLNELLVHNPPATYFVRASGDSMTGAGIRSGDILVVDRSLDAADGSIVIANVDGEFTVKFFRNGPDGVRLEPANPRYRAITFREGMEFRLFGVVTAMIHQYPLPDELAPVLTPAESPSPEQSGSPESPFGPDTTPPAPGKKRGRSK